MYDVSIYGNGQLGRGVASILRARGRHRVHGPFDRSQRDDALASGRDVVVIATTTRLSDVTDDIRRAVTAGSNVLVSAEESANPYLVDPDGAGSIDALARDHGVTVVGAGLNPGLVFDALVLTLLGGLPDVVELRVTRTVDISGFGPDVLRRIGVGLLPDEFERGVAAGTVLGHAGFPQSISLVGRALGIDDTVIDADLTPVVTSAAIQLPDGREIASGHAAGVDQCYRAASGGRTWYTAHFRGHVAPASVDWELADEILVLHRDEVLHEFSCRPCFPSQSGSQHVIANSIDRVAAAPAGWLTVADLPPAGWRHIR